MEYSKWLIDTYFKGNTKWFTAAISPDGSKVISGDDDTIKIWNIDNGSLIHSLAHTGVQSVALSLDGLKIVSTSHRKIKIWNVSDGSLILSIDNTGWIDNIFLHPDGLKIVSSGKGNNINIWDINTAS